MLDTNGLSRSPSKAPSPLAKRLPSPATPEDGEARSSLQHYVDYYTRPPDLERYQRPRLLKLKRERIGGYLEEVAEKARMCRAILASVSEGIARLKQASVEAQKGLSNPLAQAIREEVGLTKPVQLAIVRFEDATESLRAIEQYLSETRHAMADPAQRSFEACPIEKLQGKVFSLCNLHRLFEDHPQVARLFLARKADPRGLLDVTA